MYLVMTVTYNVPTSLAIASYSGHHPADLLLTVKAWEGLGTKLNIIFSVCTSIQTHTEKRKDTVKRSARLGVNG